MIQFDYKKFYNSVSDNYPEEEIVYNTVSGKLRYSFIENNFSKFLSPPFLDIGCGGGEYLKNRNFLSFGIDIGLSSLLRAKVHAPQAILVQTDAQSLSCFKDESFSSILISEVIEHLTEPEKMLQAVSNIMKKDGFLIITCPNYRGQKPSFIGIGLMKNYGVIDEQYLHTAYRPEELKIMLTKYNFTIIDSGTFEKELRFWSKPISLFITFLENKLKIRGSFKFGIFITNSFYNILKYLGIIFLIKLCVSEGNRTYIIAKKT